MRHSCSPTPSHRNESCSASETFRLSDALWLPAMGPSLLQPCPAIFQNSYNCPEIKCQNAEECVYYTQISGVSGGHAMLCPWRLLGRCLPEVKLSLLSAAQPPVCGIPCAALHTHCCPCQPCQHRTITTKELFWSGFLPAAPPHPSLWDDGVS